MRLLQQLTFLLLQLALLSALAACRSSQSWLAPGATPRASVPMKLVGSLPFVQVKINGLKHEFLLDTGASDCVVTPDTVRKLGLVLSRDPVAVRTAAGDVISLGRTVIPQLEIGQLVFKNVPALVHDCAKPRAVFPNLEGVVGYGLFGSTLLTLDYPKQKLSIDEWRPLPSSHPDVVPMKFHLGVPMIPIRVGQQVSFVDVDSGSNGGLEIRLDAVDARLLGPLRPSSVSISLGNNYRSLTGRLNGSVFLGRVQLESPIVEITQGDQRVGGEILKNLVLTFDPKSKLAAVGLEGASNVAAFSPRLVSPARYGTGMAFDPYWRVQDVIPGSVAYRNGVRTGDHCVSVGGQPAVQLTSKGYMDKLIAGNSVAFTFRRGSRTWTTSFAVEPLVQ